MTILATPLRYVGKPTQRLETRMKQHAPAALIEKRLSKDPTSAIGEHLVTNAQCLDEIDADCFSIICKAHTSNILHVLEVLYIKHLKPNLCKQMKFVKCLDLLP